MAIAADISVAANGDIRYTGSGSNYTVLELHRFLGDLADDAQASGDDLVDITSFTPSIRSTDQIIDLVDWSVDGGPTFNIDDTLARHLYNGSVTQRGGDDLYSGLRVLGTIESGTEIMIIQDNEVLPAYWGTGINPDAANNVIMQLLIKSRNDGADIDGKRIYTRAGELGDQYRSFSVTLGLANSVSAISTTADLNNESTDSTIAGWDGNITNAEGYVLIDIDNDTVDEEYYTKFDKGTRSLNDTYEFSKWVQQRAHIADNGTDVGSDFIVDNATILGQGQEFSARATTEKLVEMRFQIKIGAGTPTGNLVAELYDSDDASPAAPTGAVLATSEPVLGTLITSSYAEVIFRFNDNVTLTANQEYFAVIRHADGDASNYFHVRGLATTGSDDGNRAEDTGSWTGVSLDDLWFDVYSSRIWFDMPGEMFRGPTHEIVYDTESGGPFTQNETLFWGTQITYDDLSDTFQVGEYVKFFAGGTGDPINGGKVLKDTGSVITVALEDLSQNLSDNDSFEGITSGATADIDVTITNDDKAGGEGVLLALDDNGVDGDFYIQLISGAAPVDGLPIEGRTSGATAAVDTTVTARPLQDVFIGQTTGTNLIGAYGVGFDTNDIGSSDKFFDLTNTQRVPPNNVTFTVTGLVSGEDRVLVGPRTGTILEQGQWLLSTALTGGGETSVVIKTGAEASPIATDTPANGQGANNSRLRVQMNSGIYRRQDYVSYTASTFTIPSTDYSGANQASIDNDVFIAYIDVLADATQESYTAVYSSDRNIFVRVRDGGGTPIKTFEGDAAVFGAVSSSIAAIRTSDA